MKFIKSYKLFETPDSIYDLDPKYNYYKKVANWDDPDAFAFGIIDDKMYLGNAAETHNDYTTRLRLQKRINDDDSDLPGGRLRNKYPGRIWIDKKFISFWTYPKSGEELEKVIHMIENAFKEQFNLDIDIWNDPDFKIEINESPDYSVKHSSDDAFSGVWHTIREGAKKLIPLKDYKTSYDVPKEMQKQGHTPKDTNFRELYRKYRIKKHGIPKHKNTKYTGTEPYLKWKHIHNFESKKF